MRSIRSPNLNIYRGTSVQYTGTNAHTALLRTYNTGVHLYRRNPSLYDKAAVICGKQGGGDNAIVLTMIAAIYTALNYAIGSVVAIA
jgi:hypothetical protein